MISSAMPPPDFSLVRLEKRTHSDFTRPYTAPQPFLRLRQKPDCKTAGSISGRISEILEANGGHGEEIYRDNLLDVVV